VFVFFRMHLNNKHCKELNAIESVATRKTCRAKFAQKIGNEDDFNGDYYAEVMEDDPDPHPEVVQLSESGSSYFYTPPEVKKVSNFFFRGLREMFP